MYDPNTDTYHILYQWHPYHVNWGELSFNLWDFSTN